MSVRPKIIVIANQKGGVGKTTTAVNLAASIAAAEKRTLLIDSDPQGNASSGVGIRPRTVKRSLYDALIGKATLAEVTLKTEIATLDVIPATQDLAGAEIEFVDLPDRVERLRKLLATLGEPDGKGTRSADVAAGRLRQDLAGRTPGASGAAAPAAHDLVGRTPAEHDLVGRTPAAHGMGYEFIFIDCPPSLGLLTLNALVAANRVIVPLQCEYYALEGLTHLMATIDRVKGTYNPDLAVEGIVLTMFDPRNNLAHEVANEVKRHFRVFEAIIPRNIRLSEAPSHGKPVLLYDAQSKGAQGYLSLAREVIEERGA